ncbi:BTB/POZ protein [Nemania serpens]|nr:BTB/POZ protein [Nemania serpens]
MPRDPNYPFDVFCGNDQNMFSQTPATASAAHVPFNMDGPSKELLGSVKRLHSNGDYSDLTIVCDGKHYRVHKCIICPRSDFFAAACRGGFKEAREGKISLPDDDPKAVDLMIWYFYHLDYEVHGAGGATGQLPPGMSSIAVIDSELMVHAKVYALAEKYLIGSLKSLALEKFKRQAFKDWSKDSFLEAAQAVYELTMESDTELRGAVVMTLGEHTSLLDKESTKNLLITTSRLAYDLLMHIHRRGEFRETSVFNQLPLVRRRI